MEVTPENVEVKKSILKKATKILFWFFGIVLFFMFSLIGLLFIYEDEVKAAILGELNKHLKSEVKIDPKNIDLTIIKSFPDCSIEFKDLLMLEALNVKHRDTLLFAGQLNLHFNISDLWNGKYEIQKIKLKDAVSKLVILKNGKNNYTFWEETTKDNQVKNDSINFNLKLITLENVRLSYKDKQVLFKTELEIKNLDFKGNFSETNFELASNAKLLIKSITKEKSTFLRNKGCNFSVELNVNNNNYVFKKANISLNQLALQLSGNFVYKDSIQNLNVDYKAPNLDISSVLSLLPEKFKNKINDYESDGNFYAEGNIKYKNRNTFSLQSNFGVKNGRVKYKPQSTTVDNVNIEGSFSYTDHSSMLDLKNIYLKLNQDELKGNCRINNFSNPALQFSTQANINLENLQNFWPIDTLTKLKGVLKIKAEVEGLLSDLKNKTFSTNVKLNLDASVSNLEAQFKNDDKLYSVENCSITALEREIEVHDLKLKRGSSDIKLNGKIPGIFNYLVDRKERLIIYGNLFSNYIKLEDFIPNTSQSSVGNDNPLIPKDVDFKLNAAILKFSFAKFKAQSITGEIEIKNQKAIVSDMKLETMEGEAEINAFADNSNNKLDVVLQGSLKNINVNTLFTQFNNFGQTTIQDINIKGFLNAEIDFSASWNNRLEADYNSIETNFKMNIDRGELIDFKPLLSLAKYVDVQELKQIKFSNLQSNIEISNSVIRIPKTTIRNSVLNLDVWGTHSFNNDIDYHIQLLISDYLSKKRKNKDEEFGPVENDSENRRSAFILMTGTVDKPIIKYDKKGLKEKIKNDIKQEKQNVKQILKDEWNLFKKDTVIKRTNKSDQKFELEKPGNNPVKKPLEPKKKPEDDEDF